MESWDNAKRLIVILDHEIAQLGTIFTTYARLYLGEEEVRRLLHESDNSFFNDLYIIYLHYISVSVSRLLDPAATGKKSNLSIAAVIRDLESRNHPSAEKFGVCLKKIRAAAYNFTDPRNQLVSHMDLDAYDTDDGKKPIPSFIRSEFESFYADTGTLMNDIRAAIGMIPNMYEWGIMGHGCGRKLLHRLETAHDELTKKSKKAEMATPRKPSE